MEDDPDDGQDEDGDDDDDEDYDDADDTAAVGTYNLRHCLRYQRHRCFQWG